MSQHWRNICHVLHNIIRYMTNPLWQSIQIDRFDNLDFICLTYDIRCFWLILIYLIWRSFNFTKTNSSFLVNLFLMMKNIFIPWNLQECADLPEPLFWMQNQLFIDDWQTMFRSQSFAFVIHGRNGSIPLLQTLSVRLQIKPCNWLENRLKINLDC